MTFEYLYTIITHARVKNKQLFTIWYCVDNFYPRKDIVRKKESKLRSIGIAELRAFYGTDFIAYSAGYVRKIDAETVASINLIYIYWIPVFHLGSCKGWKKCQEGDNDRLSLLLREFYIFASEQSFCTLRVSNKSIHVEILK